MLEQIQGKVLYHVILNAFSDFFFVCLFVSGVFQLEAEHWNDKSYMY